MENIENEIKNEVVENTTPVEITEKAEEPKPEANPEVRVMNNEQTVMYLTNNRRVKALFELEGLTINGECSNEREPKIDYIKGTTIKLEYLEKAIKLLQKYKLKTTHAHFQGGEDKPMKVTFYDGERMTPESIVLVIYIAPRIDIE